MDECHLCNYWWKYLDGGDLKGRSGAVLDGGRAEAGVVPGT